MNRGLPAYARFQARDLALGQGLILLAVAALVAFGLLRLGRTAPTMGTADVLREVMSQAAVPFTLLLTGGIVSLDREHGYYRMLFSHPVSPVLYYLQRWLLGLVFLLAFLPLAAAGIALQAGAFEVPANLVASTALLYLLVGGPVFLLSTVTRRDWLLILVLLVAQLMVRQIVQSGVPVGPVVRALHAALPPWHLVGASRPLPSGGALLHVLAYGGATVAAALLVIARRPMGSGGRA